MRSADELLESGLEVVHRAYFAGAFYVRPLLSGGFDSCCAVHVASQHPSFKGDVWHIDTGIGAAYVRRFCQEWCDRMGWNLIVMKSPETYDKFVRLNGFPGPSAHSYVYRFLKERCIRQMIEGKAKIALITGARAQESVRRMGYVKPIQIGEVEKKSGKTVNRKRIWTAPCHDWSKEEQQHYMDEFGLPLNRLKIALGLSGECLCGAFAAPGERDLIRQHAPDVSVEIDRLTTIAKECGKPCEWGKRPKERLTVSETGPLCSSCDRRAAASGIIIQ